MCQDFEIAAVQVATERHAAKQRLAVVDDWTPELVDHNVAIFVVDCLPRVAEVPVQFAIRSEQEAVRRVVVLRLAGLGEQQLLVVRLVIAIGVGEHPDIG